MTIKSIIEDLRWHAFYCDRTINGCQARNILREAADALEKLDRHGRWEPSPHAYGFVRCSECHDCNVWGEWVDGKKWSYCPNCGAKMDGEGDGEE